MNPLREDIEAIRKRTANMSRDKQVIALMWAYARDLRRQCTAYANAKSDYQHKRSRMVVELQGTRKISATAAEHEAEADQEIYEAHLAYRLAEQLIVSDRATLNVLHAELDSIRTDRADARKADEFMARES
jgi:hypothetical protein